MNINITLDPTKGDQAKQLEDAMAALGFMRRTKIFTVQATISDPAEGEPKRAQTIAECEAERATNLPKTEAPPAGTTRPSVEEETTARVAEYLRRTALTPDDIDLSKIAEEAEGLFTLSDGAAGERLEKIADRVATAIDIAEAAYHASLAAPATRTRVPGQPSPGRKRRTKEEMAEDEAFNLAAGKELAALPFAPVPDTPAISTGEPRVDPSTKTVISAPEIKSDPAIAAQDRVDEKAEAQSRKGDKLTLEDVRDAVAEYTAAPGVGIPVAQRRVPEILGCPIIAIPDTQEALAKAVAAIRAATRAATKGDASVTVEAPQASLFAEAGESSLFAEPEPPKKTFAELIAEALKPDDVHATMDDCVEACKAYAMRYAGTVELAKAPCVQEDIPRVLEQALGIRQIGPSMNPKQLGRALTAINLAVTTDPFNRGKKG